MFVLGVEKEFILGLYPMELISTDDDEEDEEDSSENEESKTGNAAAAERAKTLLS